MGIRALQVGVLALLVSACGEAPSAGADAHDGHNHEEGEAASTYSEGRGVRLSESGRRAIGLQTAEVVPATLPSTHERALQVYRGADERAAAGATGRTRPGFAYASALLPAGEAAGLRTGQTVKLLGDGGGTGRLVHIDRQLEPVTGQAEALVEIPDRDRRWDVGAFVEADFAPGARGEDAVAIPAGAVLTTAKGTFVFVQNGDYLLRTPVEPAGRRDGLVFVRDGLYEGDVVASAGAEQLYLIELQTVNSGHSCSHGH